MTYDEAIKAFKPIVDDEAFTDNFQDACKMAIAAIEKQIPKKAKIKSNAITECAECDTCVFLSDRYCPRCGQTIDWSE